MNLADAIEALNEGSKITHISFTKDEYIHIINYVYTFEDGIEVPHNWLNKEQLQNGWSIFQ